MLSSHLEDQIALSERRSNLGSSMTTMGQPTPLADFLEGLSERMPLDEMRFVLDQLVEARREIDRQITQLRDVLGSLSQGRPRPSKREAVLHYMNDHAGQGVRLAEIRRDLIERGDIPNTAKAAHALQMTMVNLHKDGVLERPTHGVYLLPHSLPAPDPPKPVATGEGRLDRSAFPTQANAFTNRVQGRLNAQIATPDLHGMEGEA